MDLLTKFMILASGCIFFENKVHIFSLFTRKWSVLCITARFLPRVMFDWRKTSSFTHFMHWAAKRGDLLFQDISGTKSGTQILKTRRNFAHLTRDNPKVTLSLRIRSQRIFNKLLLFTFFMFCRFLQKLSNSPNSSRSFAWV